MFPVLLQIGPFRLYGYGVFIALGFVLGIVYSWREARRVGVDPQRILDLGFWILISAIVGARILFIITMWREYLKFPLEVFMVWKGGLVYYGGILLSIAVSVWYIRRHRMPVLKTLDILGAAFLLGETAGRWGCFSAGCCFGKPTSLPWGMIFDDPRSLVDEKLQGIPIHPTQLYASLAALCIFLFLQWYKGRQSFPGQVGFTGLLLYALERFGIEYLRGDEIRGFVWYPYISTSQFISIPVALVCLIVLFYLRSLRKRTEGSPAPAS